MNRYGRHGSGAWLRRHKRLSQKQVSTSLAVVKPFIFHVVLHITIPAGVERVIIIMAGNADEFDETDSPQNSLPEARIVNEYEKSPGARFIMKL